MTDNTPDIAGLTAVIERALQLPSSLIAPYAITWQTQLSLVPALPLTTRNNLPIINDGASLPPSTSNSENTNCYVVCAVPLFQCVETELSCRYIHSVCLASTSLICRYLRVHLVIYSQSHRLVTQDRHQHLPNTQVPMQRRLVNASYHNITSPHAVVDQVPGCDLCCHAGSRRRCCVASGGSRVAAAAAGMALSRVLKRIPGL